MPKILMLFFFGISFSAFSQDIIVKKNRDSINSKIIEVQINEIKYYRTELPNGPLYTISKNDVYKIIFKSGLVEDFQSIENENLERSDDYYKINAELKDYNLEETKSLIKKIVDSFCYDRSNAFGKYNGKDQMRLLAEFEGDYLRLYKVPYPEKKINFFLYNFSLSCKFDEISYRGNDYAYVNAYIPLSLNSKNTKWSTNKKLIIKVKGHGNAETLLNIFKHYNELLMNP